MSDEQEQNFTPAPPRTNTSNRIVVIEAIQDDNATAVFARDSKGFFATGSSKRAPLDPKDYGKAHDLATARALISLGREILRAHKGRQY